ncbi:MAG: DUF2470 domain-containing protein [Acidobacteriaceae bacterium]
MSSSEVRQHASGVSGSPQPPEPSFAERVRTLLSTASTAMLSTVSRRHAGFPFGSLMPFALDDASRPLFLISSMAVHTQNLCSDPRCSLFVAQENAEGDPLGAARATLLGSCEPVPSEEVASARETYLSCHSNSRYWVDFSDFSFFRLAPLDIYYVGGFGVMGWVDAAEYRAARPDPLAAAAPDIMAHMNADHVDSMILLAQTCAQLKASEAATTSVDRLGFWLRLKTTEGMKGARINFPHEVSTPQETRQVLVEMVRQARERGAISG